MTPGYKTISSSGESDLRAPSPAHDSSDDDFPASGLSAGTSAGESDEGQRDVVIPASLDRCLPQLVGGSTVLGLLE